MSLKSFLMSKVFLKNLAYMVGALLIALLLTSLFLRIYTHHGSSRRVPDLKGLTTSEVKKSIKKNSLQFEIFDSVYTQGAVPGTVISQFPHSGSKVKQQRKVFVTLASFTPEKVKVPNIVDVSLREAQSRLISSGLRVGRIEYKPSEFFNLVLSININGKTIPKNSFITQGTAINLVVGRGLSDEKTIVPDLIGMKINDARNALESIELNVGTQVYSENVLTELDSMSAVIWKQRPDNSSNVAIEKGSSVDLWLSIESDSISTETESDYFEE